MKIAVRTYIVMPDHSLLSLLLKFFQRGELMLRSTHTRRSSAMCDRGASNSATLIAHERATINFDFFSLTKRDWSAFKRASGSPQKLKN
jgi:hypothetical protein